MNPLEQTIANELMFQARDLLRQRRGRRRIREACVLAAAAAKLTRGPGSANPDPEASLIPWEFEEALRKME